MATKSDEARKAPFKQVGKEIPILGEWTRQRIFIFGERQL